LEVTALALKMSDHENMYEMALHNDIEGITRLLDEGVNPAAADQCLFTSQTALHVAASRGYVDLASLLMDRAPHLCGITSRAGSTALHFAARGGHLAIGELFSERAPLMLLKASNVRYCDGY
jgi:ankyrin repeat protein